MKREMVPASIVIGFSNIFLEVGSIVRQVGLPDNGFGTQSIFVREEGKSSVYCLDVVHKARYECANLCLEGGVGHSVRGFQGRR